MPKPDQVSGHSLPQAEQAKHFAYFKHQSGAHRLSKLALCAVALLSIAVAYNTAVVSQLDASKTTVVVPIGTELEYLIGHNEANTAYMLRMARWFVAAYVNVNANTVARNYAEIMDLAAPAKRGAIRQSLGEREAIISRFPLVSFIGRINPQEDVVVSATTITIPVIRERRVPTSDAVVELLLIELGYRINEGRFEINDINEFAG